MIRRNMVKKHGYFLLVFTLCVLVGLPLVYAKDKVSTNTGYLGNDQWTVEVGGDLVPMADSSYDLGETGSELANIYTDAITLNGTAYTSLALGSDGHWSGDGTNTTLDANPTEIVITDATGHLLIEGLTVDTDDIILDNGQTIDGGTNNKVILGDNSITFTIEFTGADTEFNSSDGGVIFDLDEADGTVDFRTSNDDDDYLQLSTSGDEPLINTVGSCDLNITASSGEIVFNDDNLTTTGTLDAGAATLTSAEINGTVTLAEDESISNATDDTILVKSNDEAAILEVQGFTSKDGTVKISDNAGANYWTLESDTATSDLQIGNDGNLILTVTDSNGNVTTTGNVIVADDKQVVLGSNSDTFMEFDDGVDDQLLITTLMTTATADTDPLVQILTDTGNANGTGMDADQQVFGVAKGTQASNVDLLTLDEDGDMVLTATFSMKDDMTLIMGTNSDWTVEYDEGVDNQLLFLTANTVAVATTDPMFEILVGAVPTADQEVFGVGKGTQASNTSLFNVDEDGDVALTGNIEVTDDAQIIMGSDSDWVVEYDESVDNQLLFITSNTIVTATTDPQVEFLVGATPAENQEVFGVSKGTQASNTALLTLDEDGDLVIAGAATLGTPLTAANMADVTREVRFTASDFVLDDGTSIASLSADTAPGLEIDNKIPAIVWADGETTPVATTFRVPADYSSGGAFYALCDESNSTTPQEVDFEVYVNVDGTVWDSAATGQTPVALAGEGGAGTPEVVTLSVTTDFESLAAGQYVTVRVWRDNVANGTGDLELYYLDFYYTATQ